MHSLVISDEPRKVENDSYESSEFPQFTSLHGKSNYLITKTPWTSLFSPNPFHASSSVKTQTLGAFQKPEEFEGELLALRANLREIVEKVRQRVEADLEEFQRLFQELGGEPPGSSKTQTLLKNLALKRIHELKLKPQKGRLKDLQRVKDLASDLVDVAARFA